MQGLPPNLPGFLKSLWKMLNDKRCSSIVFFDPHDPNGFTIEDESRFQHSILPRYYKTNQMNSFLKLLKSYGFHRRDPKVLKFQHPHLNPKNAKELSLIKKQKRLASIQSNLPLPKLNEVSEKLSFSSLPKSPTVSTPSPCDLQPIRDDIKKEKDERLKEIGGLKKRVSDLEDTVLKLLGILWVKEKQKSIEELLINQTIPPFIKKEAISIERKYLTNEDHIARSGNVKRKRSEGGLEENLDPRHEQDDDESSSSESESDHEIEPAQAETYGTSFIQITRGPRTMNLASKNGNPDPIKRNPNMDEIDQKDSPVFKVPTSPAPVNKDFSFRAKKKSLAIEPPKIEPQSNSEFFKSRNKEDDGSHGGSQIQRMASADYDNVLKDLTEEISEPPSLDMNSGGFQIGQGQLNLQQQIGNQFQNQLSKTNLDMNPGSFQIGQGQLNLQLQIGNQLQNQLSFLSKQPKGETLARESFESQSNLNQKKTEVEDDDDHENEMSARTIDLEESPPSPPTIDLEEDVGFRQKNEYQNRYEDFSEPDSKRRKLNPSANDFTNDAYRNPKYYENFDSITEIQNNWHGYNKGAPSSFQFEMKQKNVGGNGRSSAYSKRTLESNNSRSHYSEELHIRKNIHFRSKLTTNKFRS